VPRENAKKRFDFTTEKGEPPPPCEAPSPHDELPLPPQHRRYALAPELCHSEPEPDIVIVIEDECIRVVSWDRYARGS
jgi:hypothetical protein